MSYSTLARLGLVVRPVDAWPGPRTRDPARSPFRAALPSTVDLLARELAALDAVRPVLQMDVRERDLRLDGLPRADARPASDGVLLGFDSRHGPLRYAADAYTGGHGVPGWQANLRAIALTLEALRAVDRYGATARGEQYRGFAALPAPTDPYPSTAREAAALLCEWANRANPDATRRWTPEDLLTGTASDRRRAYFAACRVTHPDTGGDREAFAAVHHAADVLTKAAS